MWNDTDIPLAHLITFRCYGTWLHGDKRDSIDRFHNRYKTPYIDTNALPGKGGRTVVGDKSRVRGPRKAARDICGTSEVWRKQLNTAPGSDFQAKRQAGAE